MQDHVNDLKGSKYLCQVKGVKLNWETDTKTYMDLNTRFVHTAKHMDFIVN
jgi:hypothetical protein